MEPKRKIKSVEGFSVKGKGRLGLIHDGITPLYHPTRQFRYIMEIPLDGDVKTFHVGTEIPRVVESAFTAQSMIFRREWEPMQVRFLSSMNGEAQEMDTISCLHSWVGDVSSGQDARTYKKNITLKQLDPVGVVTESWLIMGAFPISILVDTDYSSGVSIYDIQMTLSFDHSILNM